MVTMRNDRFCFPATVTTYYDYVRISGWYDGLMTATASDRSTRTDTGCPLQLFMHYAVVRTG